MTIEDKQKLAFFIGLAGDYLTSGYNSGEKEYHFNTSSESDDTSFNVSHNNASQNTDTLDKIAEEISTCQNCVLAKTRKNTVPGEGVTDPLVMVIGEGPGADEDKQGRPFVGNAGQLLDKMLASINLSRTTNCFIANVVKCRPPNNRDPHPDERSACAHFLRRQIAFLKPKYILLVGRVASQSVLNVKESIEKLHGKFLDYNSGDMTIPLMITYHPSALLHNEDYKRPAWEDLKLFKSRIDSEQAL